LEKVLQVHAKFQQGVGAFRFANVSFIEDFVRNLGCEISPVCAIMGGIVAQEIIKIICHNDQPFYNFLFFNGDDDSALVENLQ
jgi:hypothetical protein